MRTSIASALLLFLPLACTTDDPENGDDSDTGAATSSSEGSGGTTTSPEGSSDDDSTAPDDSTGQDESTGPGETTAAGTTTGDSGTGGGVDQVPPVDPDALTAWLQTGEYLGWTGESGIHPSTGPHFGDVRTYVNDALFQSLDAGAAMHPVDAATVKELYGTGDTIRGWAVMVKLQDDSAGGAGWYWYELFDDSVIAEGTGLGACTGCHSGGSDYVLTPYPLQ